MLGDDFARRGPVGRTPSPNSPLAPEDRERYLTAFERKLDAIEGFLETGRQDYLDVGRQSVGRFNHGPSPPPPAAAPQPHPSRPIPSPAASPIGADYPEPSPTWLEEVKQLQHKVARLKAREVELNQRQRNRHENMEAVAADIPDILTAKFLEIEGVVAESRKAVCGQHTESIKKDLQALTYIANERCNALNKLFEIKLTQIGQETEGRLFGGSSGHLEKRICDLEEDNYVLRRRLQEEDGLRSARELELKNICVEQAKEIEDLRRLIDGTGKYVDPALPRDDAWTGVEVADLQLSEEKRRAILETHSQGLVRVTRATGQAARAGLKVGDVVTWVNTSHRTLDAADLHNALGKMRPGDAATLMVRRGRTDKEVNLVYD